MPTSWLPVEHSELMVISDRLVGLETTPENRQTNDWLDWRALILEYPILFESKFVWAFNKKQGLHRLSYDRNFEYRFDKKKIEVRVVLKRIKSCGRLFFLTGGRSIANSGAHFELTPEIFQSMFMPLEQKLPEKKITKALTDMLNAAVVSDYFVNSRTIRDFIDYEVCGWPTNKLNEFLKKDKVEQNIASLWRERGWVFIRPEEDEHFLGGSRLADQTTTLTRFMQNELDISNDELNRQIFEQFRLILANKDPDEWELTLLKGEDIQKAYQTYIGGSSCMSGPDRAGLTEIYACNPHCCRLAVIHPKDTEALDTKIKDISARCILWFPEGEHGPIHPDRIYPNNNPKMRSLLTSKLHAVYGERVKANLCHETPTKGWAAPMRWGPKCTLPYFDSVYLYMDKQMRDNKPSRYILVAGGPTKDELRNAFGRDLEVQIRGPGIGCGGGNFKGYTPPEEWDEVPAIEDVTW